MSEDENVIYETETVLENNYPVHVGYVYLANGTPVESMVSGTVLDLKRDLVQYEGYGPDELEIRRCDISKREIGQ
jgi:hypothetical protein